MSRAPITPLPISTRDDPHAQERTARSVPLLLHSLSVFREIFELIYGHQKISTVVEVGVESGQVSGVYAELGAQKVYCVDPLASDEVKDLLAENPALELVERPSPDVLPDLPTADLYVLDGDHNYATVRGELDWILEHAPDAVVVMHDVLWPCSRRDQYYQPSLVPAEDRHPDSSDGPTVWQEEPTPAGFVGLGSFTAAIQAGGERNGVLTAVEDAMAAAGADWHLEILPAVFGVGILLRRTPDTEPLLEALRPFTTSRLLATMEYNRIALYTRILQLQHDAVQAYRSTQHLLAAIESQRTENDQLKATVAGQRDELEHLAGRVYALEQERRGMAEQLYRRRTALKALSDDLHVVGHRVGDWLELRTGGSRR